MRYFKTTFMWIIVLVIVAGYSYIDFESTRIEEKRKEEESMLLPFTAEQVLAITIEKEGNELDLERWEDGWRIISPIKAKADSKIIDKFLVDVTDSRNDADYVMDPDPSPERLAEFGLANPTLRLTLKVGKDLTPHTLIFGDRAPTMGVAFAMLAGQKAVYRVLANAKAEADKDVFYFRDKSVLRLNPVMIDQMTINRPGTSIRLSLPDTGKWAIEKPIEAPADHLKVFEFISSFANAEVKSFESETKTDLGKYGLDKPSLELMFWLAGDAEPTVRLAVGDRSPEKRGYYCEMSDRDNIFILDEDIIHAAPRRASELRSKELFFFDKDKLQRIEIHDAAKSVVLIRDKEKEWRRDSVKGEVVDFNLVREFLEDLTSLRIQDFIEGGLGNLARFGLSPAETRLLVWPEDSSVPISLSIGGETPAGHVYARSGGGNEVIELDSRVKKVLHTYF